MTSRIEGRAAFAGPPDCGLLSTRSRRISPVTLSNTISRLTSGVSAVTWMRPSKVRRTSTI